MKTPTAYLCALAATLSLVATASAAHRTNSIPPASSFSARVNNPWFPLLRGDALRLHGRQGREAFPRDVMVVTHATRTIDGISCVAVSDKLYLLGRLEERTTDWYSQDARGNVWYFGERTAELDAHGQVTSTEGTWTAGVAGAQPGIYMPADPSVGQSGRQEYYKGHAEDHFKVIGRFNTVSPRGAANIGAHLGDDAARAGHSRSQDVRPRHRHGARTDRARTERAKRARLGDEDAVSGVCSAAPD